MERLPVRATFSENRGVTYGDWLGSALGGAGLTARGEAGLRRLPALYAGPLVVTAP